jgi:hypothetical protein
MPAPKSDVARSPFQVDDAAVHVSKHQAPGSGVAAVVFMLARLPHTLPTLFRSHSSAIAHTMRPRLLPLHLRRCHGLDQARCRPPAPPPARRRRSPLLRHPAPRRPRSKSARPTLWYDRHRLSGPRVWAFWYNFSIYWSMLVIALQSS